MSNLVDLVGILKKWKTMFTQLCMTCTLLCLYVLCLSFFLLYLFLLCKPQSPSNCCHMGHTPTKRLEASHRYVQKQVHAEKWKYMHNSHRILIIYTSLHKKKCWAFQFQFNLKAQVDARQRKSLCWKIALCLSYVHTCSFLQCYLCLHTIWIWGWIPSCSTNNSLLVLTLNRTNSGSVSSCRNDAPRFQSGVWFPTARMESCDFLCFLCSQGRDPADETQNTLGSSRTAAFLVVDWN